MKQKKLMKVMAGLVMTASLLAGCGNSGGEESSAATENADNSTAESGTETADVSDTGAGSDEGSDMETEELEHMEISVAIWGIQEGFDNSNAANDTIFNELEEKFNVTIVPAGVTWNDYQDKNKVWAASDSLPDVFADNLATDNNALYKTWASQGIIKEIPGDLSSYPNLEAVMNASTVQALAIDGKLYMVPRGGDMASEAAGSGMSGMDRAIYYRKDWAKEAGYEEAPKTFDEMVEMIQAMMTNHPEAAGIVANSTDYLATLCLDIMPEFANINSWVYENEQWVPCFASERVIPYIERMQKLYADGILDPDFITQKDGDAIAKFMSGYACVSLGGEFNPATFMDANTSVENFEDAEGAGADAAHFKNSFLMKVFFGGNMTPAQSAETLRKFKTDCEAYLENMGSTSESMEKYGCDMETYQTLYWQFTVDYGYGFIKNCIEWAKRCIQKLESINGHNSMED